MPPPSHSPNVLGTLSATLLASLVAGCGAPRVGPPAPVEVRRVASSAHGAAAASARVPAANRAPAPMTDEQRLDALLRGTPMTVVLRRDGSVHIEAPLRYCFDAGSAVLKPACAGTLDRLADQAGWNGRPLRITAPTDQALARSLVLATERATSIRNRLEDGGLTDAEIALVATPQGAVRIDVADSGQRSARN